jgi:hydrogenase expression/formation protein HypC
VCITAPGRVLSVDDAGALIDLDGRARRAATLLVPGIQPGDWVIVGAGNVLRTLPERDARALIDTIRAATAASVPSRFDQAGSGGIQQ